MRPWHWGLLCALNGASLVLNVEHGLALFAAISGVALAASTSALALRNLK